MATRCIKVKLVPLGSPGEQRAARAAIWATHDFVNHATRQYAELLLEMRQMDVAFGSKAVVPLGVRASATLDGKGTEEAGDWVVPANAWRQALRTRLLARPGETVDVDRCAERLRKAYALLVPSVQEGGKADDQASREFFGPLFEEGSAGGLGAKQREAVPREAAAIFDVAKGGKHSKADAWSAEEALVALGLVKRFMATKPTGRPAGWMMLPHDPLQDRKWLSSLIKEGAHPPVENFAAIVADLRDLRVLPLMPPATKRRFGPSTRASSEHDRNAFKKACALLSTWESWNRRVRKEKDAREQRHQASAARCRERWPDALSAFERFQREREAELRRVALWTEETQYTVRLRQLRGWPRLREQLNKLPSNDGARRLGAVKAAQQQDGPKFGDAAVMEWLALPTNARFVAEGPDIVSAIARMNEHAALVARTRARARCTLPHNALHPKWALFSPTGTSAASADVAVENGILYATLDLAAGLDDGMLCPKSVRFMVARSRQLTDLRLVETKNEKGKKTSHFIVRSQDGLDREVRLEVGGMDLMLDRRHVERIWARAGGAALLASGAIGNAYLKIAMNVGDDLSETLKRNDAARGYLSTSAASRPEKEAAGKAPLPGVRILSVDLGLRIAASCAIFTWNGQRIPTNCAPERTFALRLPGEVEFGTQTRVPPETQQLRERRKEAQDRLYAMRASMFQLRTLAQAHRAPTSEARTSRLTALTPDTRRTSALVAIPPDVRTQLAGLVEASEAEWQSAVSKAFFDMEKEIGATFRLFRNQDRAAGRRRPGEAQPTTPAPGIQAAAGLENGAKLKHAAHAPERAGIGGKSAWQIEHLELLRKILVSWHLHSRPGEDRIKRMDVKNRGLVASRLLRHIDALKEDRAKTTADLIVQAARGIRRTPNGWSRIPDQEPCGIIVMEDLTRYRFATDRPKGENRLLMQWAHRTVKARVAEQAQAYGISVADTGAAFSSQFDHQTGKPGRRACRLSTMDIDELVDRRKRRGLGGGNHWLDELDVRKRYGDWQAGDVVPRSGGPLIVSVGANNRAVIRGADENAAANLGKWYLQGHAISVRVATEKISDGGIDFLIANLDNRKRLQHALGRGLAVFEPAGPGLWRATNNASLRKRFAKYAQRMDSESEEMDDAALDADVLDLSAAEDLDRVVLFRDPGAAPYCDGLWAEAAPFWGAVNAAVFRCLGLERFDKSTELPIF